MRLGQKNGIVRQWARKGTRPRQPKDQRYQSLYLFGAICPARGTGAALAMPLANTHAMQAHLKEISRQVAVGAHGVILLDRAGWHTSGELKPPKNLCMANSYLLLRRGSTNLRLPQISWVLRFPSIGRVSALWAGAEVDCCSEYAYAFDQSFRSN